VTANKAESLWPGLVRHRSNVLAHCTLIFALNGLSQRGRGFC